MTTPNATGVGLSNVTFNETYEYPYKPGGAYTQINATSKDGERVGRVIYIKSDCELIDLVVNSDFRRMGFGSALFRYAVSDMKHCSEVGGGQQNKVLVFIEN